MNLFTLVMAAWILCLMPAARSAPTALYVAPNGSDRWSGRLPAPNAARTDGPLASLNGARDALRRSRFRGNDGMGAAEPAVVYVRGGTYRMAAPFVLEAQDAGAVYAAYRGERPVFSGGRVIRGWQPGPGRLWHASVPEAKTGAWVFQQLFVNGQRRTRARTPNKGFFYIVRKGSPLKDPATGREEARDRTAFTYAPGDIRQWPDGQDAQVVVYHSWETSRLRIKQIDETERLVTFTGPSNWPFQEWEQKQRYVVENIREALDAPGEWFLDRRAGVVYYIPLPGEDMRHAEVVAPRLTRLVELRGDPDQGQYVSNVTLRGLTFRHEDWTLEPQGHSDPQAVVTAPAAFMADGARNCVVTGCEISHVGDYALWLRRGCKECRIVKCRIRDMGVGGIRIGEAAMAATDQAESSGNVVDNCHIYDGGYVYPAGVGIWVAQSSRNRISHNDIHDLNYSGMSIGWNWDDAPNRCHHNVIEYNHVHHLMRGVLSDGGAIYTLGVSPGSVIRNNLFHDIWPYPTPPFGWGIYLDATCGGYLVENNVVYNTLSGDLMYNNGGHEHVIQNNIFAFSANLMLWPYWEKRPSTFRRNIVYLTQGGLLFPYAERSLQERLAAHESPGDWDFNLYWHTGGPAKLRFFGMEFAKWQALGLDRRSIIADPQFVNAAAYDFRLKLASPARKLGFQPIDVSKVGLYGDAAWVNEARRIRYPRAVLPGPPPPPKPTAVDDGFEATPVGAAPEGAVVSGERMGASIRVTDEQAARSRHSLKFTDVTGLTPAWEPHVFYQPHFTAGTIRQSFDLRLEPDALMFTEWRDSTPYPQCIGPSVVFDGEGRVSVGGRTLATVPVGAWFHVEVEAAPGKSAPKTFTLMLAVPGKAAQVFRDLPIPSAEFHALHWLGFVSNATVDSVFYVDNVKIVRIGGR
jgi:hypothetical protein